jgi:hypothetical protein
VPFKCNLQRYTAGSAAGGGAAGGSGRGGKGRGSKRGRAAASSGGARSGLSGVGSSDAGTGVGSNAPDILEITHEYDDDDDDDDEDAYSGDGGGGGAHHTPRGREHAIPSNRNESARKSSIARRLERLNKPPTPDEPIPELPKHLPDLDAQRWGSAGRIKLTHSP